MIWQRCDATHYLKIAESGYTAVGDDLFLIALAFEVWEEYRDTRKFNRAWLFLLLIPAGFGVYRLLNYFVTGSPTTYLVYQREHWHRYVRVPWEGIHESCKRISNPKVVDAQLYGFRKCCSS